MGSQNPQDSIREKFTANLMFEFALLIGSIHVILGMLRYIKRNPHYFGWILFIIGGYLYIPYYLNCTSLLEFAFGVNVAQAAHVGLYLIFGGITLAMIATVFKHGILGIFELMFAIQIFGDILSYLRIYALGYAGYIVASIANQAAANFSPNSCYCLFDICSRIEHSSLNYGRSHPWASFKLLRMVSLFI